MNKFLIREYFRAGIFTAEDLDAFVLSGDITEEEKRKIVEGKE